MTGYEILRMIIITQNIQKNPKWLQMFIKQADEDKLKTKFAI